MLCASTWNSNSQFVYLSFFQEKEQSASYLLTVSRTIWAVSVSFEYQTTSCLMFISSTLHCFHRRSLFICLLRGFLDTHLLIHSWCDIAQNQVGTVILRWRWVCTGTSLFIIIIIIDIFRESWTVKTIARTKCLMLSLLLLWCYSITAQWCLPQNKYSFWCYGHICMCHLVFFCFISFCNRT